MPKPFLYAVERVVNAPIAEVWKAWADADALQIWYCPTDLAVVADSAVSEPQVGGRWAIGVDVSAHGFNAYFWGRYSEVETNTKLAHTMHYTQDDADFDAAIESPLAHEIVIDFDARGDQTWVRFSQFGELPEGEPDRAKAGMESYFDNLEKYLAAR